jgi:hypothetical protein
MPDQLDHPLLLFVTSFLGMWASAWFGIAVLRRRMPLDPDARDDFNVVLTATLTLLGLIIGFSFSMATSRYDLRKNYEEAEANAIGTAIVRAGLLPAADAPKVRALLASYLDSRITFYAARNDGVLGEVNARTARLQNELWAAVQGPALAQPNAIVALVVSGMNDVLNSQGYTQAAWWNRIPRAAWLLMALIAVCSNVLVGYGARSSRPHDVLLLILPLVVAIAFLLIADIDSPRGGLIHVYPQNLEALKASL